MSENKKILFFGTPDFAAISLAALIDAGEEVAGVITQPDKQKGRGMKLAFSPVKEYALSKNITVYQPESLKDGAITDLLQEIDPDLITVVAYGKILPDYILNYPKFGCVNVHGSLLPKYRGAAPIQRAIMNGDTETGITTMLMDSGLDTGDILLTQKAEIGENETTGDLFEALAKIGGELLVETVSLLRSGNITPQKQDNTAATFADKITEAEFVIDWSQSAKQIHNKIRGFSPFLGAYTKFDDKILKLYASSVIDTNRAEYRKNGEVIGFEKDGIVIKCAQGLLKIATFKPEGKGVMSASDMINGRKIHIGDILGK